MKGKRVLIVERDPAGRALMERVLGTAELAPEAVGSLKDVEAALDEDAFALAIVDELAGTGAMLDEVRTARRRWPRLPVIATGTILSARVLIDLMRIGVFEALPKPFLPDELRDAVERCLVRAAPGEALALDFDAAVTGARAALGALDVGRARALLRRAHGLCPLDADVVALDALRAELEGDDDRADRCYRATLALRDEESGAPPDPLEGIARIGAYGRLPVVERIAEGWTAWLVDELRAIDLAQEPARPYVLVTTVGLSASAEAPVHLRAGGDRAVAASLGHQRPETIARVLARLRTGALVATEEARRRLDLDRVEALVRGAA